MHINTTIHTDMKLNRVTLIGSQSVTVTDGRHACVTGEVKVNSKIYSYSCHMYLHGSEWVSSLRDSEIRGVKQHYSHRNVWVSALKDPSWNAQQKMNENIPVILAKALANQLDDTVLNQAERQNLEHQMDQAERTVADAEEALRDAQEKLAVLQNKYGNLLFREVV